LLRLAAAQVHQKLWDAAAETMRELRAKNWPSRFGNIEFQIQELERQIREGKGTNALIP
jgi:predicted negative regulator of RcsB-dependent stress response